MRSKSFRRVAACTLALVMTFSMTAFAEENVVVFNDAVEAGEITEAVNAEEVIVADTVETVVPEAVVEQETVQTEVTTEAYTETKEDDMGIVNLFEESEDGLYGSAEDEELVGDSLAVTLERTSGTYTSVFKKGEYKYFVNNSGYTIYWTHVYLEGNTAFTRRSVSNGSKAGSLYNNVGEDCVVFYKYDYANHTVTTTSIKAKDWKFYDVFPSKVDWQFEPVRYCYDKGYMAGTGTNTFSPNEKLNRAMFATVIYSVAGKPSASWQNKFSDVGSNSWYSKTVTWAYNNKVVSGYSDGTFKPTRSVQRQEAVQMLYQYAKAKGKNVSASGSLNGFADAGEVANWSYDAVKWAIAKGIISGRTSSTAKTIAPKGTASRAECAAMVKKFTELYK